MEQLVVGNPLPNAAICEDENAFPSAACSSNENTYTVPTTTPIVWKKANLKKVIISNVDRECTPVQKYQNSDALSKCKLVKFRKVSDIVWVY